MICLNLYTELPVRVHKDLGRIISGGIDMCGILTTAITRRKSLNQPLLEEYKFVAHRDRAKISFEDCLNLSTHLALEHHQAIKVNMIELIEEGDAVQSDELISPHLVQILNNLPLIQPDVHLITGNRSLDNVTLPSEITVLQSEQLIKNNNALLIAGYNLLMSDKNEILKTILPALKVDGFLLTRGQPLTKEDTATAELYNLVIVLEKRTEKEHIILLKKRGQSTSGQEVIFVNHYEFSWLDQLKLTLNAENKLESTRRIFIVAEGDTESGLLGLVNCLRKEPGGEIIRGVLIQDMKAPKFSLNDPFYAKQLQMDLAINVLRPGKIWGSYRHLPLAPLKPKLVYHAYVNQLVCPTIQ